MSIKDNFRQAFNEVIQDGSNGKSAEEAANKPQTAHAAQAEAAGQPPNPADGQKSDNQTSFPAENNTGETIITRDTQIEGSIKTSSPLFLAGSVRGDVQCSSSVTITGNVQGNLKADSLILNGSSIEGNISVSEAVEISNGSVQIGDLSAREAVINGAIKGSLQIRETLILQKEAYILGDIKTGFLEITRGAVINGNVASMSDDHEKAEQRFSAVKQKKAKDDIEGKAVK